MALDKSHESWLYVDTSIPLCNTVIQIVGKEELSAFAMQLFSPIAPLTYRYTLYTGFSSSACMKIVAPAITN